MGQLANLLYVWSLCCCFQENLFGSFIPKCASDQMTVQWPNHTFKECLHCAECHPGRGLYPHKCGDTVTFPPKMECKKCDSGKTFSETYDTSNCKLCHSCAEHEVVTKKCTSSSDTKCNKTCNHGYFFSKAQHVCKMCSYCCSDGKDEEQQQCINQGFKAVHQHCSPRPDRTCNPSTTTGSVIISTVSSSSPKDPNEPGAHQQLVKIALIVSSCIATGLLLVLILVGAIYCRQKKIGSRRNGNVSNVCVVQFDPTEDRPLMVDLPVQGLRQKQNQSFESTPQGSHTGTPSQTDDVQPGESPEASNSKHSRRQPFRTEEKKVLPAQELQQKHNQAFVSTPQGSNTGTPSQTDDELDESSEPSNSKHSRRPSLRTEEKKADDSVRAEPNLDDNKDVENAQTSDTLDRRGAQGQPERKHSFSGSLLLRRLSNASSNNYQPLPGEDPDQPEEGAQGQPERKRSFSGSQLLRRLSNASSNNFQPLPGEDPDQPEEATGPQRKRSRSNSILNALRKSSIQAVKEEVHLNPDQPSGAGRGGWLRYVDDTITAVRKNKIDEFHEQLNKQNTSIQFTKEIEKNGQSWPPEEVTIEVFPNSQPQAGSSVEFQCTVRECQQVFYQWFKDGQELQGKDNSTLILDSLEVKHFGCYKCEVRSDKRFDSTCVASNVVELDVTPAEGKSYRKLAEVFDSDLDLKLSVANLLERETNAFRKAYKLVAFHYKMRGIERCRNPGEDVLDYLESAQPDLTVYQFCKVLKGENIRRLDIVNKLVDCLI